MSIEVTTNVTLIVNKTKTYCDFTLYFSRTDAGGGWWGRWEEMIGKVTPNRTGFSKYNPLTLEGDALFFFPNLLGSTIHLFLPNQKKEWDEGSRDPQALVMMELEVWQHAFPIGKEQMAKRAEFSLSKEPIIALFWK
jgi:hypothetical protein